MNKIIDEDFIETTKENNLLEVRRFFSVGADVNAKNNNSETSLIEAIYRGHVQLVKELLEHGADIEAKGLFDWTPLHNAAMNGYSIGN
jgi:ankyrin repeat protein